MFVVVKGPSDITSVDDRHYRSPFDLSIGHITHTSVIVATESKP